MKPAQLNRVLSLVKRTHDKVVVMDQETDEVLVLLPFAEYEELLDTHEAAIFANDSHPHFDNHASSKEAPLPDEPAPHHDLDDFSLEEDFFEHESFAEPVVKKQPPVIPPRQVMPVHERPVLHFEESWEDSGVSYAEESLSDVPHQELPHEKAVSHPSANEDDEEPQFLMEPV